MSEVMVFCMIHPHEGSNMQITDIVLFFFFFFDIFQTPFLQSFLLVLKHLISFSYISLLLLIDFVVTSVLSYTVISLFYLSFFLSPPLYPLSSPFDSPHMSSSNSLFVSSSSSFPSTPDILAICLWSLVGGLRQWAFLRTLVVILCAVRACVCVCIYVCARPAALVRNSLPFQWMWVKV